MSGKCDELKDKWFNAYPEIIGIEGDEPTQCYGKADVDAAIDELKTAHHKERHEYIEMVALLRRENAELKAQVNGFKNRSNLWEYNALNEHNAAVAVRMENAELKKKLENVQASMYADVVDANMENRRLKRALWLARAERASDKARIFYFAETCGVKLNIDGYSNKEKGHTRMCTDRWWRLTWLKVERKCRAKAERYK